MKHVQKQRLNVYVPMEPYSTLKVTYSHAQDKKFSLTKAFILMVDILIKSCCPQDLVWDNV